jgi:bacillithiol biosynthesis cysteine-adding enzyme BshC
MDSIKTINIKDLLTIPDGFSPLFADYLNDFQKVKQYYGVDFHDISAFMELVARICDLYQHRTVLAEVLREQNAQYLYGDQARRNIDLLEQNNTIAVVTGQQVGLFTGPLYTIYKTITALKLCEKLQTEYPSFNFVPVFWLEGEDHDFEEVNHTTVLGADGAPTTVEYLIGGKPLERNIGAVGEISLGEEFKACLDGLETLLPQTEFRQPMMDELRGAYAAGTTLNTAFARLMNKFFENTGLIFISPNDRRLKTLVSPIIRKELEEYPKVSQLIIDRSASIEAEYHAQIKPKAVNLFYFHKGGRYLIEPREHDFSLKGTRQFFTKEELLKCLEETPEAFSPNVALRPIFQDTILPTAIYVGGPSEVAYFAQLKPVYAHFNMSMPVIYPRATATILEERHAKVIEKFHLSLLEFFEKGDKVSKKVLQMLSEVNIDDLFQVANSHLADTMNEMKFGLDSIDHTLAGPLNNTHQKMEALLLLLKDKATEAQTRRHEVALRQVKRASNSVFPNGNYQERELNIISFINKYGKEFPARLKNELNVDTFEHQIIHI